MNPTADCYKPTHVLQVRTHAQKFFRTERHSSLKSEREAIYSSDDEPVAAAYNYQKPTTRGVKLKHTSDMDDYDSFEIDDAEVLLGKRSKPSLSTQPAKRVPVDPESIPACLRTKVRTS